MMKEKKKDRAILFLKMKKLRENKIGEIDAQLLTLEEMVQTIEWETQSLQVFDALKSGNQALKQIHSIMSVDAVEKLMDETADAIEYQKEIDALFVDAQMDIDDDELEAELDALSQEDEVSMPVVPETPVMPVAPTTEPVVQKTAQAEEEDEEGLIAA